MPTRHPAIESVVIELANVSRTVQAEFGHCTPAEKRGMEAMTRKALFDKLTWLHADKPAEHVAYAGIAHAWWIAGLVLQRGRGTEVRRAMLPAKWRDVLGGNEKLMAIALSCGKLNSEVAVESLSSQLWHASGLPASNRI